MFRIAAKVPYAATSSGPVGPARTVAPTTKPTPNTINPTSFIVSVIGFGTFLGGTLGVFGVVGILVAADPDPGLATTGMIKSLSSLFDVSKSLALSFANLSRTTSKVSSDVLKSDACGVAYFFSSSFLLLSDLLTPVRVSEILDPAEAPINDPRIPPMTVPTPGNIAVPIAAPIEPPAIAPPLVDTAPDTACTLV